MPEKCKKFIKLLTLEMEDLEEDLQILRDMYRDREKKGEITHYVLMENAGLLENELACIAFLKKELNEMPTIACGSYDELADTVGNHLRKKCQGRCLDVTEEKLPSIISCKKQFCQDKMPVYGHK